MPTLNAIEKSQQWIETIVIGLNFCPFAKRELRKNAVRFVLSDNTDQYAAMIQLIDECKYLDQHPEIETTLLILPNGFTDFHAYLDLHALAEDVLVEHAYEGIYQVASFHPDYCFADTDIDDAANYTNRSPFPMLHLLREASLDRAIDNYPDVQAIPTHNIEKARDLGLAFFRSAARKLDDHGCP
jgi:hypothetical protein